MPHESNSVWIGRVRRLATPLVCVAVLGGCVVAPPVRTVAVPPPPPPPRIFVYPARGQSADQQDKDRYACHVWAVQQTGIDPASPDARAYERVIVRPAPGAATVAGAIGGAIVGSILAGPYNSGAGALVGGATGAILGSSADASARAQAQQQANATYASRRAQFQAYRRAIGACLEARGYTVG